jgi:Spy/CpxP family protein refolding chaperone
MSLRVRFLSVLALSAAFAALSVSISAQDNGQKTAPDGTMSRDGRGFGKRHGGEGFRGGRGMMPGLRGIALTDAQKEQIRTIRESNKPDQAAMQEMKTLMEAKRANSLTPDQQARLKELHQQGRQHAEAVQQQILALLTPEQLQQMEQNKQEMRKRFEERRQMRDQQKQVPSTDKPTDN